MRLWLLPKHYTEWKLSTQNLSPLRAYPHIFRHAESVDEDKQRRGPCARNEIYVLCPLSLLQDYLSHNLALPLLLQGYNITGVFRYENVLDIFTLSVVGLIMRKLYICFLALALYLSFTATPHLTVNAVSTGYKTVICTLDVCSAAKTFLSDTGMPVVCPVPYGHITYNSATSFNQHSNHIKSALFEFTKDQPPKTV